MASNSLPKNPAEVIALGNNMYHGLLTLGDTLGITQITPVEFSVELAAFIAANSDFNSARSARQAASNAFKAADEALTARLQVGRNILAGKFGNRWSTMWAQAGFNASTTSVPRRIDARLTLALNLSNFLTANPSYEVSSMGFTAAALTTLRTTALTTQQAVIAADVVLKSKGATWDTAFATLTDSMRALIKILGATLDDNDPRWLTFGLQMPATNTTPGQPLNLTAHSDETGNVIVSCDPLALAARYRWRGLLVGVETEYRLVARSMEPMASIPGLAPGMTMQIIVQGVNGSLQGVPSDPIQFTMPLPAAAPVDPSTPLTTSREATSASNGSNGHPNGSRVPARA